MRFWTVILFSTLLVVIASVVARCVMSRSLSTGKTLPKVTSTTIGTNPRFSEGADPTCLNIKLQMDLHSGLKTISSGNMIDR